MQIDHRVSILVLSCDKYCDIWDNFFNLKELFWPDCPFDTYLVTESIGYNRKDVIVIKAGFGNWSSRYRNAVNSVNTPYVVPFFEDFFISDRIDTQRFMDILQYVIDNNIDFINMDDGFENILGRPDLKIVDDYYAIIPHHLPYAVDTAASIWRRDYLLRTLGDGDYSAWQFELDRCNEAKTAEGISGKIYLDLRQSLNVSKIPVVIQGKYYPPAIRSFKKKGYLITTGNRKIMNTFEVFIYYLKRKCSRLKYGRKILKYLANKVLGMSFVSKD